MSDLENTGKNEDFNIPDADLVILPDGPSQNQIILANKILNEEIGFMNTGRIIRALPSVVIEEKYAHEDLPFPKLRKRKKKKKTSQEILERFLEDMAKFFMLANQTYLHTKAVLALNVDAKSKIIEKMNQLELEHSEYAAELRPKVAEYEAELHAIHKTVEAYKERLKNAHDLTPERVREIQESLEEELTKIHNIGTRFKKRWFGIQRKLEVETDGERSAFSQIYAMSDDRPACKADLDNIGLDLHETAKARMPRTSAFVGFIRRLWSDDPESRAN